MKNLLNYEDFLNEAISGTGNVTTTKKIKIKFKIDNESIGDVDDEFTLSFSPDSTGVFSIGKDIEKYCGIPEKDVIQDVKDGKENPSDAIIYGLCNIMNGGSDIYFWNNGTRLSGASKKDGLWPAIIEQISHECTHLTRLILTRAIAKNKGIKIGNGDWITHDYTGSGEYFWPAIGDNEDKKNPIVLIDEESFATALGLIVQTTTTHFLEMASNYIPELKLIIKG
jgi:hypothetical protein